MWKSEDNLRCLALPSTLIETGSLFTGVYSLLAGLPALRSLPSAIGVMGTGAHHSFGTKVDSIDCHTCVVSTSPTESSLWTHLSDLTWEVGM